MCCLLQRNGFESTPVYVFIQYWFYGIGVKNLTELYLEAEKLGSK